MPPKRSAGRGSRGRDEEPDRPSGGRGRARGRDRAERVSGGEFLSFSQQRGQCQPENQAGGFGSIRQSGESLEQYADAPPTQQSSPQRVLGAERTVEVPPEVLESVAGLAIKSEPPRSSKKLQMAPKQAAGTMGRPIKLIANYFMLKYSDIHIYHYDVDIVFVRQYRVDAAAEGGARGGGGSKQGKKSIVEGGRTAKEDAKKNVSHIEHQLKKTPGKQRCRQIITEMCQNPKFRGYNPVYDGRKNLYTTKMLDMKDEKNQFTKISINLTEEGRIKQYEVIIKPVVKEEVKKEEKEGKNGSNLISSEPLRELYERPDRADGSQEIIIMAFDTVMCHRPPPFTQLQVGRCFFNIDGAKLALGEGLEIWFGYNQSIHLTERGPAVVVNFAAKAFHQAISVIEYANDILSGPDITRLPRLEPCQIKTLEAALTKIRVEVIHQRHPRKYYVKGLTKTSATNTRFKVDDRTEMSVADYFRQNYPNFPLNFPNFPCLHMRTSNKTTYMPMEVCRILRGQPKLGKLSKDMSQAMITETAITPEDRFDKIWGYAHLIEQVSGQMMEQFGLFLELKFMQLQGRVLGPPKLAYRPGERGPVTADVDYRGTWKMNRGQKFFKSKADACSWVLLSFVETRVCSMNNLKVFADMLCNSARTVGMNLENPKDIRIFRSHEKTVEALQYAKELNVHFALVVLSRTDPNHSYDEVKFLAEIKLGLLTQCMECKVVKKCNPQITGNVILKINSKLGGINHTLSQRPVIFSKPVIVFGADVAHSPRGFSCPSIASVVGSLDAFPFRYAVTCRVQQNPDARKLSQEIIIELEDMVKEILQAFLKRTRGKKPEKIVFFRDGVSEGQFSIVLEKEISAVQRACMAELDSFLPPLTFIVVQKRHQTRFRPFYPKDGVGKLGNVPPGTTVDTDVVHPKYFDFFLCSHEGIQGTSKPAHYIVLYDENKFLSDELQKLCYHLCHMYVRCNRSVSVPAPVMYADLACTRARKYASWYINTHSDSMSSGSSDETRRLPDEMVDAISGMKNFESSMFYV